MKTEEDEAFDEIARKQGHWGGGFQAKRQMAADKLQDGKCKYCVDGCAACDARAQPAQEPMHVVQSNGKHSPLLTHMMSKRTTPPVAPVQEPTGMLHIDRLAGWLDASLKERKRPWVGLTNEEIEAIYLQHHNQYCECESPNWGYERAIEAKLKEKNT